MFFFPGLDIVWVFICATCILVENPLGWTQTFCCWPWKGCRWIPQPPFLFTLHWTNYTEWSIPNRSLMGVLPDILWGRLLLRKGLCYRYGQYSTHFSSLKMSPLVLDSLKLQSVLFELGGWTNCPFIAGCICSGGINIAHHSVWWGPFPKYPSCPYATYFWRHEVSVQNYIFGGVTTISML